jgi:hypothetical protein
MSGIKVTVRGSSSIYGTFLGSGDGKFFFVIKYFDSHLLFLYKNITQKGSRLKIFVDGIAQSDVAINTSSLSLDGDEYLLASNISIEADHIFEFYKATEDNSQTVNGGGIMRFLGFRTLDGTLGPKPVPSGRRLEFIGDSDTCGWCANGIPGASNIPNRDEGKF